MLKKIIKRDGRIEDFHPNKINSWILWASKSLAERVDWSSIVFDAVKGFGEIAHSQDLQKQLIKLCALKKDWAHNLMAGRLYAATMRKELYDEYIPTIKALFYKAYKSGLMTKLKYSDEDYALAETFIKHERDFEMTYFQIHHIRKKYALQNRQAKVEYETSQFTFMRMAMALAEDEPKETRMLHVQKWYDNFSLGRVNAPTPNYVNLGTPHNGYVSCCLYHSADDADSLAIGDHIAYKMTCMSAGIGGYIGTRTIGDPVRSGMIVHQGKIPYYRSLAGAVHANLQGGRGGACTTYYSIFDPEAETIANLQNPRSTEDKKNRDIHFAMMSNRFFAKKVSNNEKIFTFTSFTAPDLVDAFFSPDQERFEELYNKYDKDENFKKNYVDARELLKICLQQSYEVGTHYLSFMDEVNRHTSFKEKIYSLNLCIEIAQPTAPYFSMTDLYQDKDPGYVKFLDKDHKQHTLPYSDPIMDTAEITYVGDMKVGRTYHHDTLGDFTVSEIKKVKVSPEVSLCSLAGIVECNIHSDEEYREAAYYALKMIDKCIHKSDYTLPHVGYTAKNRLNAGVGLIGVATTMARKGLKYNSVEGLNELHRIAERHSYFIIEASLQLGKELGNAPWMHKTKWPSGWLPIDTYKKTIDDLVTQSLVYDWEDLRQRIVENKGIRNSSLVAHMPTESSSKAAGVPNCIYPIRELSMKKTDLSSTIDWVAVDSDIIGEQYQIAWEIPTLDLIKVYGIFQKFADQAISADLYKDRSKDINLSAKDIITEYLYMVKYGMKSRYYQNSRVSSQDGKTSETKQASACGSGGCTL